MWCTVLCAIVDVWWWWWCVRAHVGNRRWRCRRSLCTQVAYLCARVWLTRYGQTVLLLCLVVVALCGIPAAESIEKGLPTTTSTPSQAVASALSTSCRAVIPVTALALAYALPLLERTPWCIRRGWLSHKHDPTRCYSPTTTVALS